MTMPSYSCNTVSPSVSHRSHISRIATAAGVAHLGIDKLWARYGNSGERYTGCLLSQLAYFPTTRHVVARKSGTSLTTNNCGINPITNGIVRVSSGGIYIDMACIAYRYPSIPCQLLAVHCCCCCCCASAAAAVVDAANDTR